MQHYPKSPLMGQMMSQPLLISSIIKHADRYYGDNEIVSRRVEGDIHRYTYRECHKRARQMANALEALGLHGANNPAADELRSLRVDVPHLVRDLPDSAGKSEAHRCCQRSGQFDALHACLSSMASIVFSSRR